MINKIKSILITLLAVVISASALTACSSKEETPSSSKPSSTVSVDENSATQSKPGSSKEESSKKENKAEDINPLTGLEISKEKTDLRPYAVMINNVHLAQPLAGVSKADIIYECLVEGGITRLVAIYKDPSDIETIGSIRSARPPFIELASGYDAIYICCGTSTQAETMLKTDVVDYFNLQYYDNMCYRDNNRRVNLGYEHSLMTNGEILTQGVKNNSVREKTENTVTQKFGENSQVNSGENANKMTVTFSTYKSTSFEYDKKNKTYNISQFGEKMQDSAYNIQNTADNVIAIKVNTEIVDNEGHAMLDLAGYSGTGYYMSGGKGIEIKWSKASESSQLVYTTAGGEELVMNPGRQYVCCLPLNGEISIS